MPQDQQPIPSPASLGLDGGLNLKTDPQRLQPPSVTRADNVWHVQPGNVQQLPGFVSQLSQTLGYKHIYNLATRDLSPPSPAGDLLVHGEVSDPSNPGMTISAWSTGAGADPSSTSSLPFTSRLRTVCSYLQQVGLGANTTQGLYSSQLGSARETGAARPRFALGYISALAPVSASGPGSGTFYLQTGYADNSAQISITSDGADRTHMDMGEYQGTGNFVAMLCSETSVFYNIYSYSGGIVSSGNSLGASLLSGTTPLVNVTQFAGRTLVGCLSSAAGYSPLVRDLAQGSTYTFGGLTNSTVPEHFAMASATTHVATANTVYLAIVYAKKVYVAARTGTGSFNLVAGPVSLPTLPNATTTGTLAPAATVTVNAVDANAGMGASAQIAISVFYHQYQVDRDQIQSRNITFQFVTCANFKFTAAATNPGSTTGTLVSMGTGIVRTASGTGLASKAFCASPPESYYAGPTNAKQALCLVQSGAVDLEYNGNLYNPNITSTETICRDGQPTYFLINQQCDIVGRFAEGQAPTRPANFVWTGTSASANPAPIFPRVRTLACPLFSQATDDVSVLNISIPSWVMTTVLPVITMLDSNSYPYATSAVAGYTACPTLITLTMDRNAASCMPVSTASHVYTGGMSPQIHDGERLIEQNFHLRPHPPIINVVNTTSVSGAAAGYFRLCVVWTYTDAQGYVHRSAPSLASTFTVSTGFQLTSVSCYIHKAPFTKAATAEIYITSTVNADSYRLITTVALPAQGNDFSNAFYRCTTSVTNLYSPLSTPSNKAIYTEATALSPPVYASSSPRTSFAQIAGKGRCFALAQITGQHRLYYSSVATASYPYEWNDLNYAPVPPEIGDARSLEIIDDKVIVLGTRGNAAMSGDGPPIGNTVGLPSPGDGFSPVTPVPTPAGVLGTGSPTRVPEGIVFTGYSGIQLIGRDLNIQPLGMPVDPLTGRQVGTPGTVYGRAVTLPSLQSVVYPNPRGAALVYSYLTKRWSTWPLLSNCSALVQRMDGSVWAAIQPVGARQLTSSIDLGVLSSTSYGFASGTSSAPGLVVETPWHAVGGVTGCEADLYEAELIGTWLGPHTLLIEQAYNYRDYVLPQTTDMSSSPGEYMVRVRPLQNTRVWAVRYRISLLPLTTLNAGYPMADLADLVIYSVVQGGTAQVDSARTR